jgi:hypothetical protein
LVGGSLGGSLGGSPGGSLGGSLGGVRALVRGALVGGSFGPRALVGDNSTQPSSCRCGPRDAVPRAAFNSALRIAHMRLGRARVVRAVGDGHM